MVTPVGSILNGQTPTATELTDADQKKLQQALDDAILKFASNILVGQYQQSEDMLKEALEE